MYVYKIRWQSFLPSWYMQLIVEFSFRHLLSLWRTFLFNMLDHLVSTAYLFALMSMTASFRTMLSFFACVFILFFLYFKHPVTVLDHQQSEYGMIAWPADQGFNTQCDGRFLVHHYTKKMENYMNNVLFRNQKKKTSEIVSSLGSTKSYFSIEFQRLLWLAILVASGAIFNCGEWEYKTSQKKFYWIENKRKNKNHKQSCTSCLVSDIVSDRLLITIIWGDECFRMSCFCWKGTHWPK